MVLLYTIVALFSCTETSNTERSKNIVPVKHEKVIPEQNDSVFTYLTDRDFDQIKASRFKWFNSWKWDSKKLKISDFEVKWKKTINFDWLEYNPYDKYLIKYDTLLIYSGNKLALDLYSYNTLIETEGANIFVGFDVDSKIYVADKEKKIRAEIVHGGSYEIIEDGFWLDNNRIVLLGYNAEKTNVSFLWIIDISTKKQVAYSYKGSFKEQRSNYFLVKYPKARLKTE